MANSPEVFGDPDGDGGVESAPRIPPGVFGGRDSFPT